MTGLVAKASTEIAAPAERIWKTLTDPAAIKQYFFGTNVETTWKVGAPITWKGEWEGRAYEDKGVVKTSDAPRTLAYSHFSPLTGKPDKPENYHNIVVSLVPSGRNTRVTLEQDNNGTEEERAHSQKNWETMLGGLKKYVERGAGGAG
jgi:uncharacterized protein YndB with AHSA1/START domain